MKLKPTAMKNDLLKSNGYGFTTLASINHYYLKNKSFYRDRQSKP